MLAKYTVSVLLAGAFAALSVCFGAQPAVVDDASLVAAGASPDQWLTIGRDYAETRNRVGVSSTRTPPSGAETLQGFLR